MHELSYCLDNERRDDYKMKNFEHEKEILYYNRLIRTLSLVNSRALKTFYKIILDNETCDIKEYNGIYKIELPSSELFQKAYGKIEISFNSKDLVMNNIIDVQPRKYLEDCHRKMPINYKGISIPDTNKDRFKVDLALKMLEK